MALVSKSSSRKQVLGCRHRRLLAIAFHEGYVGKAIERCEPGVDIGYHRFQQDAVCHAAHAHTVPRQSKRQRQPHGLGANVHKILAMPISDMMTPCRPRSAAGNLWLAANRVGACHARQLIQVLRPAVGKLEMRCPAFPGASS